MLRVLVGLGLFSLIFTNSACAKWGGPLLGSPSFKVDLKCENVRDIKKGFLIAHVNNKEMTPELESRTINKYIENLDRARIYFTAQDVARLKKDLSGVFAEIQKGKCTKILSARGFYKTRVRERVAFAKKILNPKKFKYDKTTAILLDPKKRGWAKNKKALEELQTRYIQYQISNRLISDKKIDEAIQLLTRSYDRGLKHLSNQSEADIYTGYLNAFSHSLDPHTGYFDAEQWEDFKISMSLQLQGIGATLTSEDGFTKVESLLKGGAAYKSEKVKAKDKIVAVGQFKDGKPQELVNVIDMELRNVVKQIRGPKGTKVRLKLMRKEKDKTKELVVTLVRDKVELEDQSAQITYHNNSINGVPRKIGVINLPSFYSSSAKNGRSCAQDVEKLIGEAKAKGVEGLVLDLSQNGGGSLDDAVKLAGLFFKTGNVVKQSQKNKRLRPIPLKDTNPEVNWSGPLVLLTSRVSASASEILAGTLKDYNRAVIVGGDHTYGKGTVQQVIELAQGLGALKVTVGMFFTPSGYSTQHRGVSSHIMLPSELDEAEIGEDTMDYSLPPKKIASFISPDAFVAKGKGAWSKVAEKTIGVLKSRSANRVSLSKDFKEIIDENKKMAAEKNQPLVLGESFEDRKDANDEFEKKRDMTDAQKLAEYKKRADVREAVNIVNDFIDITKNVSLKLAKNQKAPASVGLGTEVKRSKKIQ